MENLLGQEVGRGFKLNVSIMKPAVYLLNAQLSVAYAFLKHSPDENCPRAPENVGRERRKMIV